MDKTFTSFTPATEYPRLTRDSLFFNFSIVSDIQKEIQARIESATREIVAELACELSSGDASKFDYLVATKMIKRAGYSKYLPQTQEEAA